MADEIIFKLSVDLGETGKQIDAFKEKLSELKVEMETMFKGVEFKMPGFSFDSLTPSVSGLVSTAGSILTSGFTAIFDGIVAIAKGAFSLISGSVKMAFDGFEKALANSMALEDAMSGVKRTGNLTGDQLQELTKDVRDMSIAELKGAVSSQELAKVLEFAGQQGMISTENFAKSKKTAMDFAKGVAMTAGALDLSFEKTADSLGKFMTLMKLPAEDIMKVGNAINVLSDTTLAAARTTVSMVQQLTPTAAQYKMAASDVLGFAAAMDSIGVRPEKAATALKRTFFELSKNVDSFASEFKLSATKLQTLVQTDMGGAFEYLLQGINKMATSGPDGIQKVDLALERLGVTGDGVSMALKGLSGMGTELQEKFLNPAAEAIKKTSSITNEFESTTARLSSIWASMGEIFWNTAGQFTDVLLPTFEAAASWIREVAIAFSEWVTSQGIIETIKTSVESLWEDGIKPLFESMKESAKWDWANEARTIFAEWLPAAIETTIGWLTQAAQKVNEWLPDLIGYAGEARNFIVDLGKGVWNFFQTLSEGEGKGSFFSETLPSALKTVKDFLTEVIPIAKMVVAAVMSIGDKIKDLSPLVELFGKAWNVVDGILEVVRQAMMPLFQLVVDITEALNDMFSGNFVQGAKDAIMSVVNVFTDSLDVLNRAVKSVFGGIVESITGQATPELNNYNNMIKEVAKNTQVLGEISYGHSVFPDIAKHVGRDTAEIQRLQSSVSDATRTISSLGDQSATSLNKIASIAQQSALTFSTAASQQANFTKARFGFATPQETQQAAMQQATTTAVTKMAEGGNFKTAKNPEGGNTAKDKGQTISNNPERGGNTNIHIEFSGQNIVDESAKNRYARQTSQAIKTISKRSVTVG